MTVAAKARATPSQVRTADADSSGVVDAEDFRIWKQFFGNDHPRLSSASAGGARVPEPSSVGGGLILAAVCTSVVRPSKRRTKDLTVPRQVAMYLIKEMLGMSLVRIGELFGGRDHSTVIHSIRKVEEEMGRDGTFREMVEATKAELTAPEGREWSS